MLENLIWKNAEKQTRYKYREIERRYKRQEAAALSGSAGGAGRVHAEDDRPKADASLPPKPSGGGLAESLRRKMAGLPPAAPAAAS